MQTSTPLETVESKAWKRRAPAVTVVVSTHGRAKLLAGLLYRLEAQDHRDFEVIVADNGSEDDTWSTLVERASTTPLRLRALRLPFHDGPAVPRNTCVAEARGAVIAFTDDDCLPTRGWLSALAGAFTPRTVIVQGRTVPEPGGWEGPWGRTLEVQSPSGLYETANLAAMREAIIDEGGFRANRLLSGRPFGEDVLLGAALARRGGFAFAPEALVHHRVMPGRYRDYLEERRRLAGFPMLVREVPELRQRAYARVFLSQRTALTDLCLLGCATAILVAPFEPLGLMIGFFSLWLWFSVRSFENRTRAELWSRPHQLVIADVVGFFALLRGSIHARRVLL